MERHLSVGAMRGNGGKSRMEELLAGVARAVITPPVGIPMVGFAGRGPADDVQADLLATTLALESGGKPVFVITLDLIGVSEGLAAEVRAEIARRTGVADTQALLCASHTHYGPATGAYETDLPADVAAYVANLTFLLAGTAQEALAKKQPVWIGFAEGITP